MTMSTGERALLYGDLLTAMSAQLESIRADIAAIHQKVESFVLDVQSIAAASLETTSDAADTCEHGDEIPHLETLIEAFEQALPEIGTDVDLTSFEPAQSDAPPTMSDDFTLICGIDAEAEETLTGFGLFHFADLAALDSDQAFAIGMVLGDADRVLRESWIAQADILASGGLTAYAQALLQPVPELAQSLFMPELAAETAPCAQDDADSQNTYISHVVEAAAALAAVRAELDSRTELTPPTADADTADIALLTTETREDHFDGYDEIPELGWEAPTKAIDQADPEIVANLRRPQAGEATPGEHSEFKAFDAEFTADAEIAAAAPSEVVDAIPEAAPSAPIATDSGPDSNVIDFQSHLTVTRQRRHYRPRAIAASALLLLAAGAAVCTLRSDWLAVDLTAVTQCSGELMQGNTSCVYVPTSLLKTPLDVAQFLPRA